MEGIDNYVKEVKLSRTCRVCHDCGKYIYYGEECVKENISGSRHWHHIKCWEKRNEEKQKQ